MKIKYKLDRIKYSEENNDDSDDEEKLKKEVEQETQKLSSVSQELKKVEQYLLFSLILVKREH